MKKLGQRPSLAAERAGAPEAVALRDQFAELAGGRVEALEPLYDALAGEVHGIALWRTGSAADAADVLQEVFIKLALAGRRLAGVREPGLFLDSSKLTGPDLERI